MNNTNNNNNNTNNNNNNNNNTTRHSTKIPDEYMNYKKIKNIPMIKS